MNLFLILAFLFSIGSVAGWVLELFFRRFLSSANPERKWVNPGFCTGPYLPLYGTGLCLLYLIATMERLQLIEDPLWYKIVLFAVMAVCMTAIEYLAGYVSLKFYHVRLWDYRDEWGNFQGIICPKFSFYWAVMGALYYFLIHPRILSALEWLSGNLAFSFVIGLFYGVFIIDVVHSTQLIIKLKRCAEEYEVELHFELLKQHIRRKREESKLRYRFFRPFVLEEHPLGKLVEDWAESLEERKRKRNSLRKK